MAKPDSTNVAAMVLVWTFVVAVMVVVGGLLGMFIGWVIR